MKTPIQTWLLAGMLPLACPAQGPDDQSPRDGRRPPLPPLVKALDVNADGVIDAREIANAAKSLKTLDANGDGKLSEDEVRPPRPGNAGPGAGTAANTRQGARRSNRDVGPEDAPDSPDGAPGDPPPPDGAMAGQGPGGRPPDMDAPNGGGQPQGGAAACKLIGAFTVTGKTLRTAAQTYASRRDDVSAVYVCSGGALTLAAPTISTTGNTSSQNGSSFFGLNAAVLADERSSVAIEGGTITTSGEGANGAFATGKNSEVRLSNVAIRATGGGGHGVMATRGGTVVLSDVTIDTRREHGAALATDRGSGTILARGGTYKTAGDGSPGIYSTGRIVVSNGVFEATGSEAAVIEGQNSIALVDCTLVGHKLCGAMLYQSFSGDAEGRESHFTMRGGALSALEGPLFRVTNAKGIIALTGVKLSAASGILVCANTGRWGHTGSNGGHAVLTADNQMLAGDLVADDASRIDVSLTKGSTLNGRVQGASVAIDASSTWSLTADSSVRALSVPENRVGPVVARIVGNGHTIRYDASLTANAWLKGGTYPLANGGFLKGASVL